MAILRTREFLSEWFVAKITAIGSIVGAAPCNGVPHAWTSVTPCPDYSNVWIDPYYPVISGTATEQPAYALDGLAAVVGDIVFMRFRGAPGGMNVYEFQRISGRAQWTSGAGAPSGGVNGDWYYRTSNKFVYEKVAGVWTARSVTSSVVTGITCVSGVLTVTTKTLTTFGDIA